MIHFQDIQDHKITKFEIYFGIALILLNNLWQWILLRFEFVRVLGMLLFD